MNGGLDGMWDSEPRPPGVTAKRSKIYPCEIIRENNSHCIAVDLQSKHGKSVQGASILSVKVNGDTPRFFCSSGGG